MPIHFEDDPDWQTGSQIGLIGESFYLLEIDPVRVRRTAFRPYTFAQIRKRREGVIEVDVWEDVYKIEGLENCIANPLDALGNNPVPNLRGIFGKYVSMSGGKKRRRRPAFTQRVFVARGVGSSKQEGETVLRLEGDTYCFSLHDNVLGCEPLEQTVKIYSRSVPPLTYGNSFLQKNAREIPY